MNSVHPDTPITIIFADDHPLMRTAFVKEIETRPDLRVIAEADNGSQLVALTKQYKPDIALTDIAMPVMDGLEATHIITKECPETCVIAFTQYKQEYLILDMLSAGAKGYLLKDVHPDILVEAIYAVYAKQDYYCPDSARIINYLVSKGEYDPVTRLRKNLFSQREMEVLLLICQEKTSREIAGILGISERTVEDHRSKLLLKTDTQSVAGLVGFAIKHGYYNP